MKKALTDIRRDVNQFDAGTFLISLYGGLSFFSHLTLHGLIAQTSRNLLVRFNITRPFDVNRYSWSNETSYSISTGMLFGLIGASIIFLLCLTLITSGVNGTRPTESVTAFFVKTFHLTSKRKESAEFRDIASGLEVIMIYLLTYLLIASLSNPYLFLNVTDVILAFAFASILGVATFLLIFFRTRWKFRRVFVQDKDVQLKMFEIEAAGMRQLELLLMYGLFLLLVGVIFGGAFQDFNTTNPAISATSDYRILLLGQGLINMVMILGFFFGIWLQVFWQGYEIVECMKEYGKSISKPMQ